MPAFPLGSGTGDVSVMPGWDPNLRVKGPFSIDTRVTEDPFNARLGSQAHHAPPAL